MSDVNHLDDKTLQMLFDGELDPARRAEAEARLAQSPADRARLGSLREMRSLMEAARDEAANEAPLDELWGLVHARIQEAPRASGWSRLSGWLSQSMGAHPLRWVAAGLAVVALSVGITVFALSGGEPVSPGGPAVEMAGDELDIEGLDFEGRHPDIYQIQQGKRTTTVIWVHPEEPARERPRGEGPAGDATLPEEI